MAKRLCTAEYSVFVVQTYGIGGRKHGPAFISITCYIGCMWLFIRCMACTLSRSAGCFFYLRVGRYGEEERHEDA